MSYKFNPFTGNFDEVRDLSSTRNFSYEDIRESITIPLYQQMIVADTLVIDNNFDLTINGTLVLIN